MYRFTTAILLVLLTFSGAAVAADDLYHVRVPVGGQESGERHAATRAALARVLGRATGRPELAAGTELAELLDTADRYVQQFSYEHGGGGLQLSVRFDGKELRRALGERGVAVWQSDRPPALIWLAIEGGGERMLLGANERPALREPVAQAARAVGIPLLFPLLDLEDLGKVRFADVWGGFDDDLREASERYGTSLIVVARVHRERSGQWRGRWSLLDQQGAEWQLTESDLEGSLKAGIEELASRLAPRYASVPSLQPTQDALRVEVQGVRALRDYVRLERYLSELGGVRSARLDYAEGDAARFSLALEVEPQRVLRALRSDGRLLALAAEEESEINRFQLRR